MTRPGEVTPLTGPELRRTIIVLCFTEIVSWGVLFYAFPVLLTSIRDQEGWSLAWLVAVFTGAQLTSAAAGIWVGRHLDRYGPRKVMTGGSILALLGIVAVALSPSRGGFVLAWLLIGLAMAATLYPPAFAAVTHWAGPHRVKALTAVTLVAGLASTVFAPLTAVLLGQLDWRQTYLVLAAILCLTIPVHWWGLRSRWTVAPPVAPSPAAGSHGEATVTRSSVVRQPEFVLLAAAFTLAGFSVHAVVINLVPLLTENGLTTGEAAVALGIGGAGQVAGRLVYAPLLARLPVRARTVLVLLTAGVTTIGLAAFSDTVVVACVASFAAGTARGIFTLLQATAVTDRWGTVGYGVRTSLLSGGVTAAAAFAPWAGAVLAARTGSYAWAFVWVGIAAVVSAALVRPLRSRPDEAGRFHTTAWSTPPGRRQRASS